MRIAQRVAGFDDNQADSFLRKSQAKKKRALLDLCNQWFVYGKINEEAPEGYDPENKRQPFYDPKGKYGAPIKGGIANGYDEQELHDYNTMIDGFCSYLFNKSHACAYSFLSVCTMYSKTFFKTEFFAALLSLQGGKQEKIDLYCQIANKYGIEVCTPDINISNEMFTAADGKILYGLGSIKGVGETAIPSLIANRPYATIEEVIEKAGKKAFNKRIGEALIKAGGFDFISNNRNILINKFQDIRKDKKTEKLNIFEYDEDKCIEYEKEVLGSSITFKPFWDSVNPGEVVSVNAELIEVKTKLDKKGNNMAFITCNINKCIVKGIVFSSIYCKNVRSFDTRVNDKVSMTIQKDDKGCFITKKVLSEEVELQKQNAIVFDLDEHKLNEVTKSFDEIFETA